jgi:hypothetical protein
VSNFQFFYFFIYFYYDFEKYIWLHKILQNYTTVVISNGGSIATAVSNGGWPLTPFETAVVNTNPTVGHVALLTVVSNGGRCRSIFKKNYNFLYKLRWGCTLYENYSFIYNFLVQKCMDIRILVHMLLKLFSYECLQNEFATSATKYTNGWIMNMNHFLKNKDF